MTNKATSKATSKAAAVRKRAARTNTVITNPRVMMTAAQINAGLREYEKATGVANQNALPVFRAAAELISIETGGAWPEKSLTKAMVNASQALTDMFCLVRNRVPLVQAMKAVLVDYDAIWAEGERTGWAGSIESIVRAVRRANAPKKEKEKKADASDSDASDVEEPDASDASDADDIMAEKTLDYYAQEVLKVLRSASRAGFSPAEVIGRLKETHAAAARADAERDMRAAG